MARPFSLFFFSFYPRRPSQGFSEEIIPDPGITGVLGRYGPQKPPKAASALGLSASWENGNERFRRQRWRKPAQSPRMHDLGRHGRAVDHFRRRAALAGHHGRGASAGSQGPDIPADQRQPYGFRQAG